MTAQRPQRLSRRGWIAVAMLGLIGTFYLLREHWGHAQAHFHICCC